MTSMDEHRCVVSVGTSEELAFDKNFSSFAHVEKVYSQGKNLDPIRRCFSLARSLGATWVIKEKIKAVGLIAEENEELRTLKNEDGICPFRPTEELDRVSFWANVRCSQCGDVSSQEKELIGYAIFKYDSYKDTDNSWKYSWHVFEAIFCKRPRAHHFVPKTVEYRVRVKENLYQIKGILYCQQNGMNKACAHVALRSLLSRLVPEGDVSYKEMNRIAKEIHLEEKEAVRQQGEEMRDFFPWDGLSVLKIQAILKKYNVAFMNYEYDVAMEDWMKDTGLAKVRHEIASDLLTYTTACGNSDKDVEGTAKKIQKQICTLYNGKMASRITSDLLSYCDNLRKEGDEKYKKEEIQKRIWDLYALMISPEMEKPCPRDSLPYRKHLYAGIESGYGGLLGFRLSDGKRHIIPFFGHSFNKDTWVSDAEKPYFAKGEEGYMSSESWANSFIGHDDNFGPNYYVPKSYIAPKDVLYVVALLPSIQKTGGNKHPIGDEGGISELLAPSWICAEVLASRVLFSRKKAEPTYEKESTNSDEQKISHLLRNISEDDRTSEKYRAIVDNNHWWQRLSDYIEQRRVVLRALCLTKKEYLDFLEKAETWGDENEGPSLPGLSQNRILATKENPATQEKIRVFLETYNDLLWVVEISIPQLFPANLRKLGEIILDATKPDQDLPIFEHFILARLPGLYVLKKSSEVSPAERNELPFELLKSDLDSHVAIITL